MGKWSANGIDEVLAGKIATVIDGVNARIKLDAENETERAAPPAITYEQFVEELDLGDSFTSCLFEALVKEMAERRTRSQQAEKRMISRKTQKMLANLSDKTRVLKDEPHAARRPSVRGAFYASQFPGLDWGEDDLAAGGAMDTGEDDASEPVLDPDTLSETASASARRATEQLYESYYSRPLRQVPSFARIPTAERAGASSIADDVWGLERIFRASGGGGGSASGGNTQTANTASGAGVGRQPSIRRTARNRAVDFTDFAARRRQSNRLGLAAEAEAAAQRSEEPTPSSSTAPAAATTAQRFGEAPWNASGFGLSGSAARAMTSSSRLRRAAGGLPAEAFLLRSVSPPPIAFYPREAARTTSAADWMFDFSGSGSGGEEAEPAGRRAQTAEPQMLTPRSSTPDEGAPARQGAAALLPSSAPSVAGSSQMPASP
ncbi:hypothetical protein AURDEDRAFT_112938 [Auricularia subglabra TFB-10046 SS5]|nr:hypothetical protein AURDEDRAFT_112938 [Auricularia subglabra TFB-10046 SS5]